MNSFDLIHAVFIQDQQIKTDSLKVAEAFQKNHRDVLRKLESLDCPSDFNERNFALVNYKDAKGESRPMYEMTKDGWMFLVMGFTGAKAAQIKIAFIEAFNQMAANLHNQQIMDNQLKVGCLVQLKSGSPQFTVNKLIHNEQGYLVHAEVMWFKNRIHTCIVPVATLTLDPITQINHQNLEQFWTAIFNHGIEKLNHSYQSDTIALNLTQIYKQVPNLPPRQDMLTYLVNSNAPFPQYLNRNLAYRSTIDHKVYKCWIFKKAQITNVIEHAEVMV